MLQTLGMIFCLYASINVGPQILQTQQCSCLSLPHYACLAVVTKGKAISFTFSKDLAPGLNCRQHPQAGMQSLRQMSIKKVQM